ncbi:hypothetical protein, partial [Pacificibacter sp. AS14]|uniref:hypothetical protein n=1 Tax=Pacificibacter sp. AS14 TaxID=3135785 RepID=UPI00317C51F8
SFKTLHLFLKIKVLRRPVEATAQTGRSCKAQYRAKGQFGRVPRHQKLVDLYGNKFHRLEPITEFFNTIGS